MNITFIYIYGHFLCMEIAFFDKKKIVFKAMEIRSSIQKTCDVGFFTLTLLNIIIFSSNKNIESKYREMF